MSSLSISRSEIVQLSYEKKKDVVGKLCFKPVRGLDGTDTETAHWNDEFEAYLYLVKNELQ